MWNICGALPEHVDSAAKWIAEQVQLSETGALSSEKLQLLDERCGFDWRIGNTKDAKFLDQLQRHVVCIASAVPIW